MTTKGSKWSRMAVYIVKKVMLKIAWAVNLPMALEKFLFNNKAWAAQSLQNKFYVNQHQMNYETLNVNHKAILRYYYFF